MSAVVHESVRQLAAALVNASVQIQAVSVGPVQPCEEMAPRIQVSEHVESVERSIEAEEEVAAAADEVGLPVCEALDPVSEAGLDEAAEHVDDWRARAAVTSAVPHESKQGVTAV